MSSWNTLPPEQQARARANLTQRQIDVLTLHLAGCGTRQIATMLNLTRTTVKDHLERAINILKEDTAA